MAEHSISLGGKQFAFNVRDLTPFEITSTAQATEVMDWLPVPSPAPLLTALIQRDGKDLWFAADYDEDKRQLRLSEPVDTQDEALEIAVEWRKAKGGS